MSHSQLPACAASSARSRSLWRSNPEPGFKGSPPGGLEAAAIVTRAPVHSHPLNGGTRASLLISPASDTTARVKLSRAGRLPALAAAAAFLIAPVAHGQGTPPVSPGDASALGQQAYLYGFPLLEFLRVRSTATSVRCPDGKGNSPVNSFSNAARFATPAARTIVAPNVDTLYSIAHLDLGRGPVVLSHPNMGRRYFVFQLLDAYTNTVGYVGTRTTGTHAGRFAITWPGHRGRKVPGAKVLRSPTRRVWVIGRTLASGPADQRRAHRLMRRYRLAPPGGPRRFPKGCRPGPPKKAKTPTGLAFLDALGRALEQNPPPARDKPLLKQLATVGVGPGLRPEKAGLSEAALASLVGSVNSTAAVLPQVAKSTLDTPGRRQPRLGHPREEHRRLRHRLPLSGGRRVAGARCQHARGGGVPHRAPRLRR